MIVHSALLTLFSKSWAHSLSDFHGSSVAVPFFSTIRTHFVLHFNVSIRQIIFRIIALIFLVLAEFVDLHILIVEQSPGPDARLLGEDDLGYFLQVEKLVIGTGSYFEDVLLNIRIVKSFHNNVCGKFICIGSFLGSSNF